MFFVPLADLAAASDATSTVRRRVRLPRKILVSAILTPVFFAITIVLLLFGLSQGQPGPPGPRGAIGPSAPADPKAIERNAVTDAMARLSYLISQYDKFKTFRTSYVSSTKNLLKLLSDGNPYFNHALANYTLSSNNDMIIMIYEDIGMKIRLDDHPNFTANQLAPVPGDEKITDPGMKGIYRRMTDEYNTAIHTLDSVDQRYQSAISGLEHKINAYGKQINWN